MARQGLLHLDRINVLSTRNDHLVVATDYKQPTRIVEVPEVTGGHVTLVHFFCLAGRVSTEKCATTDEYLADLAGRQRAAILVQNPNVCPFHRLSGGVRCGAQ